MQIGKSTWMSIFIAWKQIKEPKSNRSLLGKQS
jgi:hypothetical protein